MPDVANLTFEQAQQRLAEESLQAVQRDVYDIDVAPGVVVGTDPAAGSRLDKDATVEVLVSQGPQPQTVQALAGASSADARGILQAINLTVAEPDQEFFTDVAAGTVLSVTVTPRAGGDAFDCSQGCTALEGDTASLSVSVGALPAVFGETVESATRILQDNNLSVSGTYEEFRDDLEAGLVIYIAQREGGGDWQPGDSVPLAVSKGPEPVEVPDVVGDSVSDAVAELEDQGFSVAGLDGVLPIFWDIYRVNGTSPGPGELAAPGSTITITGISF